MTFGKIHNLVSSGASTHFLKPGGVPVPLIQPPNPIDFGSYAESLTWQVRVAAVVGAPTAWSLGAKFQVCTPNTTGNQYQFPEWFDLDDLQVKHCITEGAGWYGPGQTPPAGGAFGVIATQASALPVRAQRTIRDFGLRCRIRFDLTMTGGTDPGLRVDVNVHAKGS